MDEVNTRDICLRNDEMHTDVPIEIVKELKNTYGGLPPDITDPRYIDIFYKFGGLSARLIKEYVKDIYVTVCDDLYEKGIFNRWDAMNITTAIVGGFFDYEPWDVREQIKFFEEDRRRYDRFCSIFDSVVRDVVGELDVMGGLATQKGRNHKANPQENKPGLLKRLVAIGIAGLFLGTGLAGCLYKQVEQNQTENEQPSPPQENQDQTNQTQPSGPRFPMRIDFKPDYKDENYSTPEEWDDVKVLTDEDLLNMQREMLLRDTPESVYPLLNLTRQIDCSDSFMAIKKMMKTVRNYGWTYHPYKEDGPVGWDEGWLCIHYSQAMLYVVSDAQLRNLGKGNWSDITLHLTRCEIDRVGGGRGKHQSFIVGFPGENNTINPYVVDAALGNFEPYSEYQKRWNAVFEYEDIDLAIFLMSYYILGYEYQKIFPDVPTEFHNDSIQNTLRNCINLTAGEIRDILGRLIPANKKVREVTLEEEKPVILGVKSWEEMIIYEIPLP